MPKTGSARLPSIPFLTLSSHTPSQFHSPGRLPDFSPAKRWLSEDAASPVLPTPLNVPSSIAFDDPDVRRWVLHACHAPGFPAASSGIESRTDSSSNADLIYLRTSTVDTSPTFQEMAGPGLPENLLSGVMDARDDPPDIDGDTGETADPIGVAGSVGRLFPPATSVFLLRIAPLAFLDEAAEPGSFPWVRPNQPGKPCLRLKPPGGSLLSSVALTVSVSEDPVVYVYVVNGVRSG
ncbi:hypothetical protein GP486_000136 [Trichoglossum hirsutum]|uniref:Uncharacterized protein n=1 Tax=Trichoglossum hirsutum TaxID=265104 RepID=A0A9P8LJ54_9PEZI|nr:hypothetical protein GP486_000136 [Trichoglossum hirsutum]